MDFEYVERGEGFRPGRRPQIPPEILDALKKSYDEKMAIRVSADGMTASDVRESIKMLRKGARHFKKRLRARSPSTADPTITFYMEDHPNAEA